MKILVLDDKTWELARKKILAELSCAETNAALCRSWNNRQRRAGSPVRWWDEKWIRKRHWEALRLAKILKQ